MDSQLRRYIPLMVWVMVVGTFLMISMKIVGYGYLPAGDARRHVAKAFTAKPYTDVVIMRPEYAMDHSPGWEWLLRRLHVSAGLGKDALMAFSIVVLLLCVFLAPLPWLRRPEAWLAALLAQMVAIPELMGRYTQARPYLITEGILTGILFAWSKPLTGNPSWKKLALTTAAIAFSVWMHGAWYLWAMMLPGYFLARWWRAGLWLSACWLAGSVAGALLTGHPYAFLKQAVVIFQTVSRENAAQWMLVGELTGHYGEFPTLLLLAVVYLWRRQATGTTNRIVCSPVLWMIFICWMLGFKADRCWADWGIPAVLVWLAMQFEDAMSGAWVANSRKCLMAAVVLAAPLYLLSTSDLSRRYTRSVSEAFLDASDPDLSGWLPEGKGIFYSGQLGFFYNTFYQNPEANWRYLLGFEPALMPEDDLKTYRQIQLSGGTAKAWEPWVNKMDPADRLAIYSPTQPELPGLEWHQTAGPLWIGRKPR